MKDARLEQIRDIIQQDVGRRGLASDPLRNLFNICAGDFAGACNSIAATEQPAVGIVTGFFIPHASPPAAETDGPLGALFLARAFHSLGIRSAILTDGFCRNAIATGLADCRLKTVVPLMTLPSIPDHWDAFLQAGWKHFAVNKLCMTHLIAIERPGPSHTLESLQRQLEGQGALGETYLDFLHEVPQEEQDVYHNASGKDIGKFLSPAHRLFEYSKTELPQVKTIGIGDGGNEIGMGKIPWDVIRRNIPGGGKIACRIPADFLISCGVSNWGAYALGNGVAILQGKRLPDSVNSAEREEQLLKHMVEAGPLVDGILGQQLVSVDGLSTDRYLEPLRKIAAV